jgi:hypothetical protein
MSRSVVDRLQDMHGYWQIDFRIVAETIALDLGPLKETASRLIELVKRSDR